MNIVEAEADYFYRRNFINGGVINVENLKSLLNLKLYNFNRDRDKLDFLKILRNNCEKEIESHLKRGCVGRGCDYEKKREIAIFVIDQEIDEINKYYTFEPQTENKFTSKEESQLQEKLNEIIDELKKQKFGQQIIFEEIEDLKNHFNLGKKTWFQLLKGKLVEMSVENILEKTIIENIFNNLSEDFKRLL